MRFVRGANDKYAPYLRELQNAFLNGNDDYPSTLNQAYNIMQRRSEAMHTGNNDANGANNTGIAFATVVSGTDGHTHNHITCHQCHEKGHYTNQCPEGAGNEGNQNEGPRNEQGNGQRTTDLMRALLAQSSSVVPGSWVLLDNHANVDLFHNKSLLQNIRRMPESVTVHCNAGTRVTNLKGDLPGYPHPVWYCPHAIANVLSFDNIKSTHRWRITYDSEDGDRFVVTTGDGSNVVFENSVMDGCSRGLYYCDSGQNKDGMVLVSTVKENRFNFTNAECTRASEARDLQIAIGRPSTRDFIRYVSHNLLPNCPVTKRDIMNAETIYGPDLGSLKGKTTRQRPHTVRVDPVDMPPTMMEEHQEVTICVDIMYVNKIPFLVSLSRKIK